MALKIGKGHQLFLKKLRLDNGTKLGYLYAATKFHKDGSRFIAGMPNCSTTKASKVLSDIFTVILTVLEEKDDAHIQRTGIRRFFVVKGFEEVADFLKKWKFNKNNSRLLKTGDFSNAYTSIPHGDVVEKLSLVFEEVWKFMAEILGVTLDKVKVQWLGHKNVNFVRTSSDSRKTNEPFNYTLEGLIALTKWLIDNTFVVNGDACYRQRSGIPMGTNAGPGICNLYLYYYESTYIDKLVSEGLFTRAEQCHITFRLIDDDLSIDNPGYEQFIKCYPPFLTLNDTTLPEGVNFLGMHITEGKEGKLKIQVYDKRKDFPFKVVRYPHLDSEIPTNLPYGVFTGLTHRNDRICTEREDFIKESVVLAKCLQAQGAVKHRLVSSFTSYLSKKSRNISTIRRSFTKALNNSLV